MWWVISNPNRLYVGNDGEMVPWIQHGRVFSDRDEAVSEATNRSTKTNSVLNVIPLAEAAYLDAMHAHKEQRKDKRARKAPASYLPYSGVFTVNADCDDVSFAFNQMRSLYLAVRGAEVVGIIGEADGQVISLCGTEYDIFMQEFSVVPTCPSCGEPLHPDDDDEEDDEGPFDPADLR